MKRSRPYLNSSLAIVCVALLSSGLVFADKPDGGKERKHGASQSSEQHESDHEQHRRDDEHEGRHGYFNDERRTIVHNYFAGEYKKGHCPPGLAKKNNGCRPPGQVKAWVKGKPLPKEVEVYELPHSVVVEIGMPPAGQKLVRVGTDILLISVGTGLILEALEDLDSM